MGWWKTGQNNDIIGDAPADMISSMFDRIVRNNEYLGKEKPTLSNLLAAILIALRSEPEKILNQGDAISIRRLVATINSGATVITSQEGNTVDDNLANTLREEFELITGEYQESLERKPKLSELLACVAFILGANPEKYLSGIQGGSVEEIVAELV